MKHYTSINDIDDINSWIEDAKALKINPLKHQELGVSVFFVLLAFLVCIALLVRIRRTGFSRGRTWSGPSIPSFTSSVHGLMVGQLLMFAVPDPLTV